MYLRMVLDIYEKLLLDKKSEDLQILYNPVQYFIYLFIYLFIHLFIYLVIYLFVYLFIYWKKVCTHTQRWAVHYSQVQNYQVYVAAWPSGLCNAVIQQLVHLSSQNNGFQLKPEY